jgi:hypothetical protein
MRCTKLLKALVVLGLWAALGCSIKPGPEYFPPTSAQIIWQPKSKEGKQLKSELLPSLERLLAGIDSSKALQFLDLKENSVLVVDFEESGRKRGLEIDFGIAGVPGSSYEDKVSECVTRYLPPLAQLIGQQRAIIENPDLDCFVVSFHWIEPRAPVPTYTKVDVVRIGPGGQPLGGSYGVRDPSSWQARTVGQSISLDIPMMVMRKIANSEIPPDNINKYVHAAGPRAPI